MRSLLPLRRLRCVVALLAAPGFTSADIISPVDRSYFETAVTVVSEPAAAHLPGRPRDLFAGAKVTLLASPLPGDDLQWFHNGTPLSGEKRSSLRLVDFAPAHAGVYWARITRAGYAVDTSAVTLNLTTAPTASLVDTGFQNRVDPDTNQLLYTLMLRNDDGEIGYLRSFGTFVIGSWGWLGADGDYREDVHAWGYLDGNVGEVSALLPDGSHLRYSATGVTRVDRQGNAHLLNYDGETPLESNAWTMAQDGDLFHLNGDHLLRLAPDGALRWTIHSTDFGWANFARVIPFRDGSGHLLIQGNVDEVTPMARVIRADGSPLPDSEAFPTLADYPLTRLQSGDWLELTNSRVRRYDAEFDVVADRELGPWGVLTWSPQSDGYLYALAPELGVLRLNPALEQDLEFAVQMPADANVPTGNAFVLSDDKIYVSGTFASVDGHPSPLVARLDPARNARGHPPLVRIFERSRSWEQRTLTLDAIVVGTGPFTYEWRNLDRPELSFSADRTLKLNPFDATNTGRYVVKVTSPTGTAFSEVQDWRETFTVPLLRSLTARAPLGPRQTALKMGFVLAPQIPPALRPNAAQVVIARGIGPTLADLGVETPLNDPALQLIAQSTTQVWTNDDWAPLQGLTAFNFSALAAIPLRAGSHDSQLDAALTPGVHHLEVTAKPGDQGIALGEVFALYNSEQNALFSNLSLLALTGEGDAAIVGGFVIDDPSGLQRPLRLLIRAVGPTLRKFGVDDVATDPVLRVFDHTDRHLGSNDNWSQNSNTSAADLAAIATAAGAFALDAESDDAALLLELSPGVYTAQVTTADGASGQALLELYLVPASAEPVQ